MRNIRRGDVYYVTRNYTEEGSEQHTGRPAVIVSNDINNKFSSTVEVVFLTTQPKKDLPTHCAIRSTSRISTAICEQINTVSIDRINNYIATVTPEEMKVIDACLLSSLGIDTIAPQEPQEPTELSYEDYVTVKVERDLLKKQYDVLLNKVIKQEDYHNENIFQRVRRS